MELLLLTWKLIQASSKASMQEFLVLFTHCVVAVDSLDIADACASLFSTMASVVVVVDFSAKVTNIAVGADLLGVLEFLGDFPAKEVDTAVGADSVGVLEFMGNSAVVVVPVAAVTLVAAVAAEVLVAGANSSAKVADTAVGADLLGVLEFLGDFPAKEVESAVGMDTFGVLEFSGNSAVVVALVAAALLVAAVAAVSLVAAAVAVSAAVVVAVVVAVAAVAYCCGFFLVRGVAVVVLVAAAVVVVSAVLVAAAAYWRGFFSMGCGSSNVGGSGSIGGSSGVLALVCCFSTGHGSFIVVVDVIETADVGDVVACTKILYFQFEMMYLAICSVSTEELVFE